MTRSFFLIKVLLACLVTICGGCEPQQSKASLPVIQEIVANIESYASDGTPEVKARAKEVAAFVLRMKEEGELQSRPVEVSRTIQSDVTTIVGYWERTYKLTMDTFQPGHGTVAVTIDSGSGRSSLLLGVRTENGIDLSFRPSNLEATLKDSAKLIKLFVLTPNKDGYAPTQSFSDLYRLLGTQEQLEVTERDGDMILRAHTPKVEFKFKIDTSIHMISCDFARS